MSEIIDGKQICTPSTHAESHEAGGDDELDLSGLPGSGAFTEDGNDNIFGGSDAGTELSAGSDNFFAGANAGKFGDGSNNIKIGNSAGQGATGEDHSYNIFIGDASGFYASTGGSNVGVGHRTVYGNQRGNFNVAIGRNAGEGSAFQSWSNSTAVGYAAGWKNVGDNNVNIGSKAGYYNGTGENNVVMGAEAGYGASGQSYSNNVFIGYQAGYSMTTGTDNIFIGYQAGYSETGSNKLYIDNSNTTTPLIYGEFDNDLVRINGDLEVTGKLTSGSFKNKIINGNFDIWQRGTSFAAVASSDYVADRFTYTEVGAMVHTVSIDTDVPTFAQSGIR